MWCLITDTGWSADSIADAILCPRQTVWRYLYGDRLPSRKAAIAIQAQLGIEASRFDEPPTEPFSPPGARPATGTDG